MAKKPTSETGKKGTRKRVAAKRSSGVAAKSLKASKAIGKPRQDKATKASGPAQEAARKFEHIEFIARGLLVTGSRVLMCRSKKHGYLYLPGGHVEFGESAAAATEREFLEESGLRIRVLRPLLVSEAAFATKKRRHAEVTIVFHVEPGEKAFRPERVKSLEEKLDLEWIDLAAVSDLDVRPPATKAFLAALDTVASGLEWVSDFPT